MKKIEKSLIVKTSILYKRYSKNVKIIEKRINYIINYCIKKVGGKVKWWAWDDDSYENTGSGNFMKSYQDELITIRGEFTNSDKADYIDKFGDLRNNFEDGYFLTRWLYEDFEKEFTDGLKNIKHKKSGKIYLKFN